MRKALAIAVVLLLVVTGLAVLMPGMGGAHCANCDPGTVASAMCLAVLAATAALLVRGGRRLRRAALPRPGLLRAMVFDRPPQFALAV